jgi:hypothetical protein
VGGAGDAPAALIRDLIHSETQAKDDFAASAERKEAG